MIFCASASRSLRWLRFGSANCSGGGAEFGFACRPLTIHGMQSARGRERDSHDPRESRIGVKSSRSTVTASVHHGGARLHQIGMNPPDDLDLLGKLGVAEK
jgi:hypothetical protein